MSINISCVKWGDKYDRSFVERLKESLNKHLTKDFNFICYTDKPEKEYDRPVIYPELRGWWHKLSLVELEGKNLVFDLDIQINDNIDFLADEFGILTVINSRSWKSHNEQSFKFKITKNTLVNSSIMRWKDQKHIIEKFNRNRDTYLRLYSGIDRWLYNENIEHKCFETNLISSWLEEKYNTIVIENGKYSN